MFRKEHTENDCRYKDFSVCKKCGFSHIGCTCYVDNIGILIYYRGKFNNTKILEVNKTKNDNIYFKFYRINKFVRKIIGKKKSKILNGKNMIKKKTKKLKLKIKIKIMMKLRIFKIKENNFTFTYSEAFINNKNNNNKLINYNNNYNNIIDISSRK